VRDQYNPDQRRLPPCPFASGSLHY
jgi:hypothetical protein